MAKIAVFDSGLGSLSIIRSLQKTCKMEIIYFADQKNFPYGTKTEIKLEEIIKKTIKNLDAKFSPDLIIIGSNTPTIILGLENRKIIGVNPPLNEAIKISKTKNIAVLATKSLVNSNKFLNYIESCKLPNQFIIHKINSSNLVELVESGKFLTDENYCRKIIRRSLKRIFSQNKIDVATLSSTHLPFLKKILKSEFPNVQFIDPADNLAIKICKKIKQSNIQKNSLKIYSSDQTGLFQKNLIKMGIKKKIKFLSI